MSASTASFELAQTGGISNRRRYLPPDGRARARQGTQHVWVLGDHPKARRASLKVLCPQCSSGDANLDSVVDGSDFNIWNAHKFTVGTGWGTGDFNGDGLTDGSDFSIWNANKFTSSDGVTAVPEPVAGLCLAIAFAFWAAMRRC